MPTIRFQAERFAKKRNGGVVTDADKAVVVTYSDPGDVTAQFGSSVVGPESWVEHGIIGIGGRLK